MNGRGFLTGCIMAAAVALPLHAHCQESDEFFPSARRPSPAGSGQATASPAPPTREPADDLFPSARRVQQPAAGTKKQDDLFPSAKTPDEAGSSGAAASDWKSILRVGFSGLINKTKTHSYEVPMSIDTSSPNRWVVNPAYTGHDTTPVATDVSVTVTNKTENTVAATIVVEAYGCNRNVLNPGAWRWNEEVKTLKMSIPPEGSVSKNLTFDNQGAMLGQFDVFVLDRGKRTRLASTYCKD